MAGFAAYDTPKRLEDLVDAQVARWEGVIDKQGRRGT
jgi:hypothetical protein